MFGYLPRLQRPVFRDGSPHIFVRFLNRNENAVLSHRQLFAFLEELPHFPIQPNLVSDFDEVKPVRIGLAVWEVHAIEQNVSLCEIDQSLQNEEQVSGISVLELFSGEESDGGLQMELGFDEVLVEYHFQHELLLLLVYHSHDRTLEVGCLRESEDVFALVVHTLHFLRERIGFHFDGECLRNALLEIHQIQKF